MTTPKNEIKFLPVLRLAVTPLAVSLMSVILYASITMFAVAAFSKDVGYKLYTKDDNGYTYQYTYKYADGEDKLYENYDESKVYKQSMREFSDGARLALHISIQIITAYVFVIIIYYYMWPKGDRDRNRADFGKLEGDRLYGLKTGLWASVPYALVYLLLVFEKIFNTAFGLKVFKLVNFSFFYIIELITDNAESAAGLELWTFLPLLAILALMPAVSYIGYSFGYGHISIKNKLMYGKNNGGR